MKKYMYILALFFLPGFTISYANPDQVFVVRYARAVSDNVKVYQQPSTATDIMKSLKTVEEVLLVRPHNDTWTIVQFGPGNRDVGYVLTSELVYIRSSGLVAIGKDPVRD